MEDLSQQTAAHDVIPLPWAWSPRRRRNTVFPIFLPFRGCPVRCVFCAQEEQTGCRSSQTPIPTLLAIAREALQQHAAQRKMPTELAFYGGTFTAMPEDDLRACLNLATEALERGWINTFRCSTRPDSVNASMLKRLRTACCDTVELGIQSFSDSALAEARRGYDAACALQACADVLNAGLRLGVQLLPGMPGNTPEIFLEDVTQALEAGAQMLRFYPCLVLEGTQLAKLWRKGQYVPWTVNQTLDTLARGWLAANMARVPVIRMGLAPQAELESAILDGPVDPALGNRVMARGLLMAVRHTLSQHNAPETVSNFELFLPPAVQGCLWGHKGELRSAWSAMGLQKIHYWQQDFPAIRTFSARPSA
ncbi:MAG: radical SAM protein [Desulfovibrio sp.]|nr:radical SAM protein [Desulfovibrio sp.]